MYKQIFVYLLIIVGLSFADSIVPFSEIEGWLDKCEDLKKIRGYNLLEQKAAIVHSIDRRDIRVGMKSNGYGRANFSEANRVLSRVNVSSGGIVERTLKADETHYYYYKTDSASSIKATLAYKEDETVT